MRKASESDERITRYLLGDLPDAEQLTVEREYFADPEKFEQVRAAETELVDGYVRGRLSRGEQELFERHYLQSPGHRGRVAFARSLLEAADREGGADASRLRRPFRGSSPLLMKPRYARSWPALGKGLAAAALVLLVAGLTWLMLERERLNNEIRRAESEVSEQRRREQEIADQLAAEREQTERLTSELDRLQATPAPTTPQSAQAEHRSIVTALLSPMLIRGEGEPQQIAISSDTGLVRLQMRVEPSDSRMLKAAIRTVEGVQVWNQRAARTAPDQATAVIPVEKLPIGDYILTLSANGSSGESEELHRYFFRVRGR